jgi:transposase-like protein
VIAALFAQTGARFRCLVQGHRRGKRDNNVPVNAGENGFRCPRCKATWTRKVKA